MSAAAKFWRTFAAGMVGVLGSVGLLTAAGDYRAAGVALGLGVATAVIAGGISAAMWAIDKIKNATTPPMKALYTFLQMVVAGLGTVAFNSVADLTAFPKLAATVGLAAVVAAIQTFFQTSAEEA